MSTYFSIYAFDILKFMPYQTKGYVLGFNYHLFKFHLSKPRVTYVVRAYVSTKFENNSANKITIVL